MPIDWRTLSIYPSPAEAKTHSGPEAAGLGIARRSGYRFPNMTCIPIPASATSSTVLVILLGVGAQDADRQNRDNRRLRTRHPLARLTISERSVLPKSRSLEMPVEGSHRSSLDRVDRGGSLKRCIKSDLHPPTTVHSSSPAAECSARSSLAIAVDLPRPTN